MLVPNMTEDEIIKEVRKDYDILKRKMHYHAQDIRRLVIKGSVKLGDKLLFDYTSKYKNHWIYRIICFKKEYDYLAMLVYHSGKGHVCIEVAQDGTIMYHTGHFFLRYNERLNLGLCTFNDIVRAFMHESFVYHLQNIDQISPDVYSFFGRIETGIILGTANRKKHFARINTFLPESSLSYNQKELHEKLRKEIEKYKDGANDRL